MDNMNLFEYADAVDALLKKHYTAYTKEQKEHINDTVWLFWKNNYTPEDCANFLNTR